jgi:hypothetical protein
LPSVIFLPGIYAPGAAKPTSCRPSHWARRDDLDRGAAGIDKTNPQAAGIGWLRLDDAGDHEILERRSLVVDVLDLETDFG